MQPGKAPARVCCTSLHKASATRAAVHRGIGPGERALSVRPRRLDHISVCADAGAAARHVRAKHSVGVRVGAGLERLLRSRRVLVLAQPGDDARLLQSLAVREGQMPRHLVFEELVHHHEVDGCRLLVVLIQSRLPRKEEDARHRNGHCAEQGLDRVRRHGRTVRLGARKAVLHHVWLQDCALEVDVVQSKCLELGSQYLLRHLRAVGDVVGAVGHDLGLHDGHEALALADGGVTCQGVHRVLDGQVAGQALCGVKLQDVPPLGEAGTLLVGLGRTLLQVIETEGGHLGVPKGARFGAPNALLVVCLVQLDAWDHAVPLDDVHHVLAAGVLLEERLPVQDDAADVLAEAGRREAHAAVGRPVLNGVRDLLGLGVAGPEPRPRGLVGRQEALAGSAQFGCRLLELNEDVGWQGAGQAAVHCGGFAAVVHLGHVDGQVNQAAAVTPLVVVPGNKLDEGLVQGDAGTHVED
mmetsp:Transcript_3391/g.10169  ORF Transcript_3391/g.10169 Transcript_3391/m.10169 type:complete len:468 (-) Transcript_3391:987-2390(-)